MNSGYSCCGATVCINYNRHVASGQCLGGQPDFREGRPGGHTHRCIHVLKYAETGHGASIGEDFGKEIYYAPT